MKKTQLIAALLCAALLQSTFAGAEEAFLDIEGLSSIETMNAAGFERGGGFGGQRPGGFQPPQRSQSPRQEQPRWNPPPRQEPPRWNPPVQRPQPQRPQPPVWRPQPPVNRPQPPVQRPQPPVWHPQPPVNRPQPPVNRPQPPVNRPQPPVNRPQPPVNRPQPPVNRPQPPVNRPQPPVNRPQPPVNRPPFPRPPVNRPPQRPPLPRPPVNRPPQRPPVNPPDHPRPPIQRPPIVVRPQPGRPGQPGRGPVVFPRRPDPIRNPGRIMDPVRNGHEIHPPRVFPGGAPITARPINRGPHGNQITIINNTTVINNVRNYNRWENEPGRYYWHDWDGRRFCHYYDSWGFHWYGWYFGSVYFWTRYWNDMYWWYDPYFHRWVYMRDGRWWWQDPDNITVVYVYVPETNNYYQYNNVEGGVVLTPDPTAPVDPPPSDPAQPAQPAQDQPSKIFYSADGRRSVQVFGDANDAYLYDTAETPAFDPVYLASGVTEARFSQTAADQPLTVLLLTETTADDGTVTKGFRLFDENGNDLQAQQPQAVDAPVAPPSDNPDDQPAPSSFSQTLNALRAGVNW